MQQHNQLRISPTVQSERAFTLYCHGLRVEAIADALGASIAAVRQWIADTLNRREILTGEGPTGRSAEVTIAIEGYRAIAGAAWTSYEEEHATLIADRTDENVGGASIVEEDATTTRAQRPLPRRATNYGARYLAIALTAQREIARLQGLYEHRAPEAPNVRIMISERPEGPENHPPTTPASQPEQSSEITSGMNSSPATSPQPVAASLPPAEKHRGARQCSNNTSPPVGHNASLTAPSVIAARTEPTRATHLAFMPPSQYG